VSEPPITDVQRDAALTDLRRAAEDGRLDPAELDRRSEAVRRAATAAELVAVSGLPVRSTGGGLPSGFVPAGYSQTDPLVIGGRTRSRTRDGEWALPPFVRIQNIMESVRVNFLLARPQSDLIDIEIGGGVGSIRFVVPDGWALNVDRLAPGLGSIRVRVPSTPAPGCPLLVVHGSAGVGSFRARGPHHSELRRLARGR
jgi:hypothetical protein